MAAAEELTYRLPRTVDPRKYRITLAPDLQQASFSGEEEVDIQVHQAVEEVVLNALELDVHSAQVAVEGGGTIAAGTRLDPDEGRLVVSLDRTLGPGLHTLQLSFSGTLNDKLRGFYRSTFTDEDGKDRVIATTQFEPTDARRAFPCWDEPDRKAVFSVTLDVAAGLTAVSNSAVEAESESKGRRRVRFADTIPMSTYLVAFVVGPLEATDAVEVDGVALRVVHVPGKAALAPFALEIGAHALRFFSAWFGIPYPGRKLDLIALPDFAHGAMENLGAVTFRESVLLIDPKEASRLELERVSDVVAHEIAHMWFGDLVTMRWWNGLWLNEAFATLMEMLCVDDFRPHWERWVTFGRSRGAALSTDGLSSTRPIEFPVARPEEAEGMFDILTYEKGAGVLRMLERYLGGDAFRRGLRLYIDHHQYANAETTDLWDAIETATGEPARQIMDSWIFQGGYPLVTAEADGSTLRLSQEPFRYRPVGADGVDPGAGGSIGSDWHVPVLVRAEAGGAWHEHRVLVSPEGAELDLAGPPDRVVVNAGGWGFYRTRYEPELHSRLIANISSLVPLERFNLVSDAWAGVLAGLAPLGDYLDLCGRLRHLDDEPDPNVWAMVTAALGTLDRMIPDAERGALEGYTRALLRPPLERVGWDAQPEESERLGTLRGSLLESLGTTGADPEVRSRLTELHDKARAKKAALDPDLAGAAVSVIAATGGQAEYEMFLERFRDPSTPQEELRYMYGLAGFRERALLQRTLDLCLTEIRSQNAGFVIAMVLANRIGGQMAWEFVKSHWDELKRRLPDPSIPRMLEGVATLTTDELAADAHAFLGAHPVRSGQRTVEQMLERLDVNLAFVNREAGGLAGALSERSS